MTNKLMRELGLHDWDNWQKAVRNTAQPVQTKSQAGVPPTPKPVPQAVQITVPSPPSKQLASNAKLAVVLDELSVQVKDCTKCKLCNHRTNVAFDRGVRQKNQIMIIGEGPGEQEDLQGKPFVGQAGQLLDLMLATIGLDANSNVNIANIIKCRPPENRNPEADEIESCLPYLHEQINILAPKLIIALGKVATGTLLSSSQTMRDMRAKVHSFADTPLIATYHPAYLLRAPKQKSKAWEDLLLIKQTLATLQ